LHCGEVRRILARGLCTVCHRTPAVCCLYPPIRDCRRRQPEVPDFFGRAKLPADATQAQPGSQDKVAVLEARAAAGLALFHPGDIRPDLLGRPGVPACPTSPEEDHD